MSSSRTIKISVEGNIATGKSTFIEFLKNVNPTAWHVVPEPVSEWTKIPDSEKVIQNNIVKSPLKSPIRTPQKNKSGNPSHEIEDSPSKKKLDIGLNIQSSPVKASPSPIRVRPTPTVPDLQNNMNDTLEEEVDEHAAISCPSAGNLLDLFYSDTQRWAYTFQSYAILSRMRCQKRPPPKAIRQAKQPVMFYERSLYTDRYIFARNCLELGTMTDLEWDIYSDWSDYLLDTQGDVHIHGVIYLRADPETSYTRLNKRSRSEEKGVTLEYLTSLHKKHEAWLHDKTVEKHKSLYDVPILELDCNKDFESDEENRNRLFEKVRKFAEDCHRDQLKRRIVAMEADKENMAKMYSKQSSSSSTTANKVPFEEIGGKKQKLDFNEEICSTIKSPVTAKSLSKKIEQMPFSENPVFGVAGDDDE